MIKNSVNLTPPRIFSAKSIPYLSCTIVVTMIPYYTGSDFYLLRRRGLSLSFVNEEPTWSLYFTKSGSALKRYQTVTKILHIPLHPATNHLLSPVVEFHIMKVFAKVSILRNPCQYQLIIIGWGNVVLWGENIQEKKASPVYPIFIVAPLAADYGWVPITDMYRTCIGVDQIQHSIWPVLEY